MKNGSLLANFGGQDTGRVIKFIESDNKLRHELGNPELAQYTSEEGPPIESIR